MTKPRLELTWIGKETRPRLEPRILIEDPTKNHHAAHRARTQLGLRGFARPNLFRMRQLVARYRELVKVSRVERQSPRTQIRKLLDLDIVRCSGQTKPYSRVARPFWAVRAKSLRDCLFFG